MDMAGEQHIDVMHDVYKERLTADGQPILSEKPQKESKIMNLTYNKINLTTVCLYYMVFYYNCLQY